jgi:hypothetical protein
MRQRRMTLTVPLRERLREHSVSLAHRYTGGNALHGSIELPSQYRRESGFKSTAPHRYTGTQAVTPYAAAWKHHRCAAEREEITVKVHDKASWEIVFLFCLTKPPTAGISHLTPHITLQIHKPSEKQSRKSRTGRENSCSTYSIKCPRQQAPA